MTEAAVTAAEGASFDEAKAVAGTAASAFANLAEAAAFAETKSFFEAIPGTVSAAEGLKKTESKALVSKMLPSPASMTALNSDPALVKARFDAAKTPECFDDTEKQYEKNTSADKVVRSAITALGIITDKGSISTYLVKAENAAIAADDVALAESKAIAASLADKLTNANDPSKLGSMLDLAKDQLENAAQLELLYEALIAEQGSIMKAAELAELEKVLEQAQNNVNAELTSD